MRKLELTRLVRTRDDGPLPGDKCPNPNCNGLIGVYCKRNRGQWIFRFLECKACKYKPPNNKMIDPAE